MTKKDFKKIADWIDDQRSIYQLINQTMCVGLLKDLESLLYTLSQDIKNKKDKWEIIFKTDLLFDIDNADAFLIDDDLNDRLFHYLGSGPVRIRCRKGCIQIEKVEEEQNG